MKKQKLFIILGTIILVLLAGGIALYFTVIKNDPEPVKQTDAQRFALEYSMSEDNVFVYRDAEAIIKIMEKGTGVVYLGFPECPWCKSYVKYLNEVAKEVGIEKIYYYNVLTERPESGKPASEGSEAYEKMVNILKEYLEVDAEGNERIYVPNVSFHIDGFIIGNDLETAYDTKGFETPEEYWTEKEVSELKKTLKKYMEDVHEALNVCTDCNK